MRAIAALAVVICHSGWMLPDPAGWMRMWFNALGHAGVDVFFVISGFIMTKIVLGLPSVGRSSGGMAAEFALRRLARVYPPYWMVVVATYAASPFIATLNPTTYGRAAEFLLLAPSNGTLMVAWTLTFELAFYAACVVGIGVLGNRASRLVTPVLVALAASAIFGAPLLGPNTPLLLEFLLGSAVAVLIRWSIRLGGAALSIGAVLSTCALIVGMRLNMNVQDGWNPWLRVIANGVPSAAILFAIVKLEEGRLIRVPTTVAAVGDASYAMYLWHILIQLALLKTGLISPGSYWSVAIFAAAVLILSIGVYRFLEAPLLRASYRAIGAWLHPRRSQPTHAG